jgi:hypothetical protein
MYWRSEARDGLVRLVRDDILDTRLRPIGSQVEAQATDRNDHIETEDHSGPIAGVLEVRSAQCAAQLGEVHPAGEFQLSLDRECRKGHDNGYKTKSFHDLLPDRVISKWAGYRAQGSISTLFAVNAWRNEKNRSESSMRSPSVKRIQRSSRRV